MKRWITPALGLTLAFTALVVGTTVLQAEEEAAGQAKAKPFTLTDTHGKQHALSDYKGKYVVLEWVNHGCPFVQKFYKSGTMQKLQKKWSKQDVVWLQICSSAPGKQGHMKPEAWNKKNKTLGTAARATLIDAKGKVGKAYGASHTPHMFVIDPEGRVVYEGAIDSIRSVNPEDIKEATNYVEQALEADMNDKSVEVKKTRAYGCSVKY